MLIIISTRYSWFRCIKFKCMELEKRLAYQANTGVARRNGGTAGCEARPSHDRQVTDRVWSSWSPPPVPSLRRTAITATTRIMRRQHWTPPLLSLSLSSPLASRGLLRRRFLVAAACSSLSTTTTSSAAVPAPCAPPVSFCSSSFFPPSFPPSAVGIAPA